MRLLLINPNTTEAITELVLRHARPLVGPEVELRVATGRFGARYIACRVSSAVAGHAALDALAAHVEGCDAVLLACFGDPGLAALQELSPVPVVGMAEAACRLAARSGRFSIVTGGVRWEPMLRDFVASLGLADRLASIRAVAPTGGEISENPDRAIATLAEACRDAASRDGAESVILGGAGLAGLAARVAPHVPVPVICSLEASIEAVLAAARSGGRGPAPLPARTIGLSPALAAAMAGPGTA